MAVRSTNTYSEGLQSLIQDIASLQLAPDSNVEFLMQVQQMIISEAQAPLRAQAQQAGGPPAPAGNVQAAMPAGGPPAGGMAELLGIGGPGGGSAPLPPGPGGMPSGGGPAELDRILG